MPALFLFSGILRLHSIAYANSKVIFKQSIEAVPEQLSICKRQT